MRILRIITRLNIGGPAIHAARLTTDLVAYGHEPILVHGRPGPAEGDMRDLLPPDASNVVYVDALRRPIAPAADARAFAAILRLLRRTEPDIVHTHMAKAGLIGRAAAIAYNCTRPRSQRARIVHTYHGHVLDGYFRPAMARTFVGLERMLARASDALVAISPRVRDELVDRFAIASAQKFRIVPLGLDLAPLAAISDHDRVAARDRLGIPPGTRVVATVGRLTAIKRHDLFLDVARVVAQRVETAVFLVAGDGELRASLEARAAALGIAGRVRWLGWRRDLETIYGASDAFVLTSRNEGTPVALIEAMAAGVPGVATDVGGVRDVIVDESVGRVVPSDAAAISSAVVHLLQDDESRRQTGRCARASVVNRYDAARLVADIDELYRSLIQDNR